MNQLNWIWNNISIFKDFLWIIFTFIATVIAILTYRRARYTILQPLRSEVIKKQTELFIEIMELFHDGLQFAKDIDFLNVIRLNNYYVLDLYGFKCGVSNELQKIFDDSFSTLKIVKRNDVLNEIRLPELFQSLDQKEEKDKDVNDDIKVQLETGKIDIELLGLTKKYEDTLNKYKRIANNPFLPREIKSPLEEIINNIEDDFSVALKETLEQVILEVYEKSKNGEAFGVDPAAINNIFIKKRHNNYSQLIEKIRKNTREYLMIDKKWG